MRTSFGPVHSISAPRSPISAIIVSTSRIRGTLRSTTGSVVSRHAARIGRAPFLFPAAVTRPFSGCPPSMTKYSASASVTAACAMRGYPSAAVEPTRERAWETLTRYTKSEALLRHALAVEAAVGAYATRFGEDDELCGFIHACGLVRPDGIETLEPKSVRKKLKQPSFAAGVNRDDVYEGAEALGVDLNEHVAFVIDALRPIAPELGLRTTAAPA